MKKDGFATYTEAVECLRHLGPNYGIMTWTNKKQEKRFSVVPKKNGRRNGRSSSTVAVSKISSPLTDS